MTLKMYDEEDVKFMFFCYLEGFTHAKRMFYGEKIPIFEYHKTAFYNWLLRNFPKTVAGVAAITEQNLSDWLNEYIKK